MIIKPGAIRRKLCTVLIGLIVASLALFAIPAQPAIAQTQSFYQVTPVEVTPGTANDWIDVDVSSYTPSGTTGVILRLVNPSTTNNDYALGLRKNGSTDNRTTILYRITQCWAAIGVDANRVFEAYVGSTTAVDIYLVGYTKSGVTFFTNAYDKSLETTTTWTDIDCQAVAPNAIGLIFEVVETSGFGYAANLRPDGSTDNRTGWVIGHSSFGAIVGCSASQVVEGYITATTGDFYLVGYITDGCVFNTNAIDTSINSSNSYAATYLTLPLVAYRARGTVASGTTGAISPGLPAGMVANDVCIMVASTLAGGSITITADGSITPWTAVTGSPINVTGGDKLYVWWGRYSSGSTAPTLTPGGDHSIARIAAYINVSTGADPIDVYETGTETNSDTTFSFATTISTSRSEMCLVACSTGFDGTSTAQFSAWANAGLLGITEILDSCTANGGGGGFGLANGYKSSAGAIGTWSATLTNASAKAYIAFALKSESTAPAGSAMSFIEVSGNVWYFDLRKYGSSEQIYNADTVGAKAFVACDNNGFVEGKVEGAECNFYITGYAITSAGEPAAEVTPTEVDFGICEVNTTASTAINWLTVSNTGVGAIDIEIKATDATGGNDTWTLIDAGNPGENTFGLYAGLDDNDDLFDIRIKKNSPYNYLVEGLAEEDSQDWGIKLYMPTSVTGYDGQTMTSTVTLIVSASG